RCWRRAGRCTPPTCGPRELPGPRVTPSAEHPITTAPSTACGAAGRCWGRGGAMWGPSCPSWPGRQGLRGGTLPRVARGRGAAVRGQGGLGGLWAGGLLGEQVASVAVVDALVSLVTQAAYPPGTCMGLLAPGLLRAGDVPHLAALTAPRRLVVAGGRSAEGKE